MSKRHTRVNPDAVKQINVGFHGRGSNAPNMGTPEAVISAQLIIRLTPSALTPRRLETQVTGLIAPARLRELFRVARRATDVAEFERALGG